MTDAGYAILAFITLAIIGLAFEDARKADEEESKMEDS